MQRWLSSSRDDKSTKRTVPCDNSGVIRYIVTTFTGEFIFSIFATYRAFKTLIHKQISLTRVAGDIEGASATAPVKIRLFGTKVPPVHS